MEASLGGRYAIALFELARDARTLDAVEASLAALTQALDESADFRTLIRSPLVDRPQAGRAVAAVAEQLGLDPTTRSFLGVLAHNGRLAALPEIARIFRERLDRHYGRITAHVTSAHPLADDQVATLEGRLASRYGRDVTLDLRVDPSLLGGLVVRVGSQQVDGSIRTKLNSLAQAMKG